MLRMFSKFAYQALTRLTFGYSGDAMVAREEFLLSDSASFGNVFQIRVQFYATCFPLLSSLINTTPFPPDPSDFHKCFPNLLTRVMAHYINTTPCYFICTKHFLRNGLQTQPQTFCTTLFPLSLHLLFSQHKHRRILFPGYHSVE